jgi:hypothetical protein
MVGKDQSELGAAQSRQACALCQRQVKIVVVIDNLGCGLKRSLRVDADLGGRT